MVYQTITPLSLPIPEGASIAPLFEEWRDLYQRGFEPCTDEESERDYTRNIELQNQIAAYVPTSARDLAMQIVVETNHGDEWRDEFWLSLMKFAKASPEPESPSPRIISPTVDYQPKIDMDKCSIAVLRKLCDLLWSLSEIINATLPQGEPPVQDPLWEATSFLDELQALISCTAIKIAAQVQAAPSPTDDDERRERSWLIARAQVQCAEGDLEIGGPGAPVFGKEQAA